jgi:hypothetical protein
MKTTSTVLIILGCIMLAFAGINLHKAPNVSFAVGTFLPGILLLAIGLKMKPKPAPPSPLPVSTEGNPFTATEGNPFMAVGASADPSATTDQEYSRSLELWANFGVGLGIVLSFSGGFVTNSVEDGILFGLPIAFAGWSLIIWGCVNYARWKGYSGWFGLFGYLMLPGLIVLVCLPNRRKRMLGDDSRRDHAAEAAVRREDLRHGGFYLLSLVPLAALFALMYVMLLVSSSNVRSAEWKWLAPSGAGFRAALPGALQEDKTVQETPLGPVEVTKFYAEAKKRKELYMIVLFRCPEALGRQMGGAPGLLELARKDVLVSSNGQLKSERRIALNGINGLEMEVLPRAGAVIKARIFATEDRIYQVSVHVPKVRLQSQDVKKFLSSFELLDESDSPDEPDAHD